MPERPGWSNEIARLHAEEGDDHVIGVTSRATAIEALRRYAKQDGAFIEIGSCFGHTLVDMISAFPNAQITGSDTLPEMLDHLRARVSVPIVELDILDNDLRDASADAIVCLNVLEHIEDDHRAVREITRILKPGGMLICEVPAGPQLYDGYDAFLQHFRRYTRKSLSDVVTSAGLEILERSAVGFVVYPGFWAVKKLNQLRYGTEPHEALVRKAVKQSNHSALVNSAFALERWLRGRAPLPFGIRHTLVATKPSGSAALA